MNLESLIQFLIDNKQKHIDEFASEGLDWDSETVGSIELSLGEMDTIIEVLSAFVGVEFEEDEDDEG